MAKRLVIPDEGEMCLSKGLISPELAIRASRDTNYDPTIAGTRHFLSHICGTDPDTIAQLFPRDTAAVPRPVINDANEARAEMYYQLLDALDLNWKQIIGYARVMSAVGGPKGGLGLHTDNSRDIRALVNGDGPGLWIFRGKYQKLYPNGLPLLPGDVAMLNNHCPPDDQVEHGAQLLPGVPIRTSFLFHVRGVPPQ